MLLRMLVCALGAMSAPPAFAATDLLRQGVSQEARLDLFGARQTFREALRSDPEQTGLVEHAAWFLYRNGFHDGECLELMEKARVRASDPKAASEAIDRLRSELGLSTTTFDGSVPYPRRLPAASDLPGRLQYARELFWSRHPAESESAYEALLIKLPEEPALHLEIARVEITRKRYAEAAAHLAKARSLRPSEPEIALEQSRLHLARARVYHYSGEFPGASREYRAALAADPNLAEAAYGLAETDLRIGAVPEARLLLSRWPSRSDAYDWPGRLDLYRETAAPRLQALGDYFRNSLNYRAFDAGLRARLRPFGPLELTLETTHGWYDQTGFSGIERQTGAFSAIYQPNETYAFSGFAAVNGYSTGWTSANGGAGFMLRPNSALKLDFRADRIDVVDSEPPLGFAIYSLATTIGAVGGRAVMTQGSVTAAWEPLERVEIFGKYRGAAISERNTLSDCYLSMAYGILRNPSLKIGYGFYHESVLFPAPVYRQGNDSAAVYYDPRNLNVQNLFLEWSQEIDRYWSSGLEAHFYQNPANGGVGVGPFAYVKYAWRGDQSVRLDARDFDQNRGLNRDGSASGHYSALNFVFSYALLF
jgi:tetratricopeptide (TPR) repeat protein